MRLLSLALLGLSLLAFLLLLGISLYGSPIELLGHFRAWLHEQRRREVLEREAQVAFQRLEERARVMAEVEAGSLSLFEAAARFQRLGFSADRAQDGRVRDLPTDEAGWCRTVLRFLHSYLGKTPSGRERVLPPLLQAYRQRFGELPADLDCELRQSSMSTALR